MTEQPLDLWAERRGEVAVLVGQLSPSEALEVLSRVVADATDSTMLAPVLIGCIRGVVGGGSSMAGNGSAGVLGDADMVDRCLHAGRSETASDSTAIGAVCRPRLDISGHAVGIGICKGSGTLADAVLTADGNPVRIKRTSSLLIGD